VFAKGHGSLLEGEVGLLPVGQNFFELRVLAECQTEKQAFSGGNPIKRNLGLKELC